MDVPIATYRLQLQPEFGFGQAADIVSYLSELGISHVYASPIFRARKGSLHGYDCVDPNDLNPELGSLDDWKTLVGRLREYDMGWLQDIVPNHMAFDVDNRMLADVLENGMSSRFRDHFDICWNHPSKDLQGRVMAPFLGQRYGECLEKGEIRIVFDRDGFAATYGDLKFPLQIETYLSILDQPTASIKTELGEKDPAYNRWIDALDDLESLVLLVDAGVRQDHGRAIKQTLWDLFCGNTVIRRLLSETLRRFNGEPGNIHSYQRLDGLLSQQRFRLCYWQVANEEINYRRFFDINELIALRQDKKAVFEYNPQLLGKLASEKRLVFQEKPEPKPAAAEAPEKVEEEITLSQLRTELRKLNKKFKNTEKLLSEEEKENFERIVRIYWKTRTWYTEEEEKKLTKKEWKPLLKARRLVNNIVWNLEKVIAKKSKCRI